MLITNILSQHKNKNKKILYSYTDNKDFIKLLSKVVGNDNIAPLEDSIFSHSPISLIICNNKQEVLEKCIALCLYFHCSLLIVDHMIKPSRLSDMDILFPGITHFNIAINSSVASSWGEDHYHAIANIDIADKNSIHAWTQIIHQASSQPFKQIKKPHETKYSHTNQ